MTSLNIALLISRPNAIALMVNWHIQVKFLTDSEMIWAGMRWNVDRWRSCFTICWTDNWWMFSCSATQSTRSYRTSQNRLWTCFEI